MNMIMMIAMSVIGQSPTDLPDRVYVEKRYLEPKVVYEEKKVLVPYRVLLVPETDNEVIRSRPQYLTPYPFPAYERRSLFGRSFYKEKNKVIFRSR